MRILIVEDNEQLSRCLTQRFREADYEVSTAATLADVRELTRQQWPDFVLLDANFPTARGQWPDFNAPPLLNLLEEYARPFPPVLLMSGEDKTADYFDTILKWLRTGRIADILPKSTKGGWDFLKELLLHRVEIHRSIRSGAESDNDDDNKAWLRQQAIISEEPAMFRIAERIKRIVERTLNDTSMLITGPSGSGKGKLAQAIHAEMQRLSKKKLPYVSVACGALPDTTAISDLLGAAKGAFTSADKDRPGLLEAAGDGVFVFDDIHGLPKNVLGSLLSVLQERKYRRLGSEIVHDFRARAICTTNVGLDVLEKQGLMTDEFYNRIARFTIVVPPLAQRPRDIEPLLNHFLANCRSNLKKGPREFDRDVVTAFQMYGWPGDVRQLENIVQEAATFVAAEKITLDALRSLDLTYKGQKIEWNTLALPAKEIDLLLVRFQWHDGWAKLESDDFGRMQDWLLSIFQKRSELVVKWTDSLRDVTDPKAIHYLKALLYIGIVNGNIADHKILMHDVLGLSWGYTDRVVSDLASTRTIASEVLPPLLEKSMSGRKWTYTLSPHLA